MDEIDSEIKNLQLEKKNIGKVLVANFCPYKVGQKAKYLRVRKKNVGSFFQPKFEVVSRKEEILVCVEIAVSDYNNSEFRCQFKRLKPDGTLTSNYIHVPKSEIEWLDEYYEPKK